MYYYSLSLATNQLKAFRLLSNKFNTVLAKLFSWINQNNDFDDEKYGLPYDSTVLNQFWCSRKLRAVKLILIHDKLKISVTLIFKGHWFRTDFLIKVEDMKSRFDVSYGFALEHDT